MDELAALAKKLRQLRSHMNKMDEALDRAESELSALKLKAEGKPAEVASDDDNPFK